MENIFCFAAWVHKNRRSTEISVYTRGLRRDFIKRWPCHPHKIRNTFLRATKYPERNVRALNKKNWAFFFFSSFSGARKLEVRLFSSLSYFVLEERGGGACFVPGSQ